MKKNRYISALLLIVLLTVASTLVLSYAQIEVYIDIKPGSFPNSINTKSNGLVPVAILSSDDFDASQVDVDSVRFGPGEAEPAHKRAHLEDVDLDGDLDLVIHFHQQETGLAADDTEAELTGQTLAGTPFMGSDSIK